MTDRWKDEIRLAEGGDGVVRRTRWIAHFTIFLIAAFFVIFVLWAQRAELDEVTRGPGKIIPSGQTKIIQHFEGGIVTDIPVNEGQVVEEGQVLMRVENRSAEASLSERQKTRWSLQAEAVRLSAEAEGKEEIDFPPEVLENAPRVAADERSLFRQRRAQLQQQVSILEDQYSQRAQELREQQSRVEQLQVQLDLAVEERDLLQPLVAQGAASQVQLLQVRQQVAELNSQLQQVKLAIPRTRTSISEAKRRIEEKRLSFRAEAQQKLNDVRAEAARIQEDIEAGVDRARRTELRSPVRGTVNKILINTIGGVVKPGDPVAEIVPLEDSLLVEARIRPADRAALYPGLAATVKISAYDYSIHGGLDAELLDISADTILDEQGESYFRVRLRTEQSSLGADKPIIPGMTATVDILTGEKTVLQYLLKPIVKAKENALTER